MKVIKLVLPLTLISAVCAAVLAIVDSVTRGPIANIATLKANAAAKAVLPAGVKAIDALADPGDATVKICVGYADNDRKQILGYAVPGHSASGYGGDIRLMVGLAKDRSIVTYKVLAANETPGLGAKLGTAEFSQQFTGKPAAGIKVKKDGGDIDAITGATITSRAVCGAIADANARVDRLEGKASTTAPAAKPAVNEGKQILDPAKPETALKVLPRGTVSATVLKANGRFPIFEGKDAAGKTTGFAVVGTGTGKGPDGEIAIHYLYGLTPAGQISRLARPLPVNQLDISTADMISAQTAAINAAMRNAEEVLKAARR